MNKKFLTMLAILIKRVKETDVMNTAVVVAYYLLLSLFPILIVIGNLLPLIGIHAATTLPYLEMIFPKTIYTFLEPAIKSLLTNSSGGLLSVSAIAAFWSASQGINALQRALNKAYGVSQRGNFFLMRLASIGMIGLLLLGIVGAAFILAVGQVVLDALQPIWGFPIEVSQQFAVLKWPLVTAVLLLVMFVIYWRVPNAKLKIRWILPGTFFATAGWLGLAQVFGLYAQYFAGRVNGYQIIGSFIVLMLWLVFAALILIIGGIMNGTLSQYKTGEKLTEKTSIVKIIQKKLKKD